MNGNGDMDGMGMKMANQRTDMNKVMYPEMNGLTKSLAKSLRDTSMDMDGMDMGSSSDMATLNYGMRQSIQKTKLPNVPFKKLRFNLTGNMNRTYGRINNKTVSG